MRGGPAQRASSVTKKVLGPGRYTALAHGPTKCRARYSSRIATRSRHFEVQQDLADRHAADLFRRPAKLLGQNKAGLGQRCLDNVLKSAIRDADAADVVDLVEQKSRQAGC